MSEDYESGHQHTYILAQWLSAMPGITRDGLVSTQIGGGQLVVVCSGCGDARIVYVRGP